VPKNQALLMNSQSPKYLEYSKNSPGQFILVFNLIFKYQNQDHTTEFELRIEPRDGLVTHVTSSQRPKHPWFRQMWLDLLAFAGNIVGKCNFHRITSPESSFFSRIC
jgi:hypothetical protein